MLISHPSFVQQCVGGYLKLRVAGYGLRGENQTAFLYISPIRNLKPLRAAPQSRPNFSKAGVPRRSRKEKTGHLSSDF